MTIHLFSIGTAMRALVLALLTACTGTGALAQKVGVVLSGGGATAFAHVGFLRALEESDIPVDYIGGTSMGAVVAGMYAAGLSVHEIDSIVRTEEFMRQASGESDDDLRFYFLERDPDASVASIKYSDGEFITNALPTNLINPTRLDWNLMAGFSQADAASGYDFDSLYIPFRCTAADVEHKREVVFSEGPMNIAIRASSTYPFYLPPLRVNGSLMFDGGLYNNFPADVMYMEFMPDVILGCNVSDERISPDEDDLFSQLESMILHRDAEQTLCEAMLVVKPVLPEIGTFDFELVGEAIRGGYQATMLRLEEIKALVDRRVTLEEKQAARRAFRARFKPFLVDEIIIEGVESTQKTYVRKLMGKRKEYVHLSELRTPYFRVMGEDKIRSIFPVARYKPDTDRFSLSLDVKPEKDLIVSFGGNFSSRSINTGFVGLRYNLFGRTAVSVSANSYFGRFYGSIYTGIRWDIGSASFPMAFELSFTQNRWDYYKSLATFFEDVKPSFILLNERFGTLSWMMPAGNKGVVRADASYAYLFDEYYQTRNFLSVDTADRTTFDAGIFRLTWERNTLNRVQYASKGTFLQISAKWVTGLEQTIPGSTSAIRDTSSSYHQWYTARIRYENYFFRKGRFHTGLRLQGVYSNQPFFLNYISSSIAAPAYHPIPESSTYFLPQFRAHQYVAGGLMMVYEVGKNLDIRLEGHVFNAFGRILSNELSEAVYDYKQQEFYIASSCLVYHSPLGPVSISANYYDQKEEPWSILFNFGYIIFNRSARD